MQETENFNLSLQEPNETTISIQFSKEQTLGALEDRIEEVTRDAPAWPHYQRDQFLILVRGIIINERYTRNVKLKDIQGQILIFRMYRRLHFYTVLSNFNKLGFNGNPDASHFILEISVGRRRIRHKTTLKLTDEFLDRLKID